MNPVLMPVHNLLPLTIRALGSISLQDIPVHVMVVNDGSTDETRRYLSAQSINSVSFNPPKGVTAAWNLGLHYFFQFHSANQVLVVNNDTVLRPDTYSTLLADGGLFVTGISVSTMAETSAMDPTSKSPHPDFSCFLIRRECWQRVGEFDSNMLIYASDNDYHVRMHRAGIEAHSIALPFFHERSSTIKQSTPEDRDRIQQIADGDRSYFQKKYGCMPWDPEYAELFK